jgi:Tol biopolymer transport system component
VHCSYRSGRPDQRASALWFISLLFALRVSAATPAELLVEEGANFAARLSPDGGQLLLDLQGALSMLPASGGAAQAVTDGLGDDRLPTWRPDGQRIAFQSFRDGSWQVYSARKDGRDLRQLTDGAAHAREPVYSADGQRLVFASDRAGNFDLWELQLGKGELRSLTRDPATDYLPSGDGAGGWWFVSTRSGRPAIWRRSANGEIVPLEVDGPRPVSAISPSPDGLRIAWVGEVARIGFPSAARHAVAVLELASRELRLISDEDADVFPFAPQWLDDGTLLYTADGRIQRQSVAVGSRAAELPMRVRLRMAERPGQARPALSGRDGLQAALGLQHPQAAADGRIFFTALGDIWQRAADGRLRQLTDDAAVERDLALSADDKQLWFVSDRDGPMRIWRLEPESGRAIPVGDARGPRFPTPSPDGSKLAWLQVGPRGTQDFTLRVLDLDSGETRRLRSVPGLWPERLAWSAEGAQLLVTSLTPASKRFRAGSNRVLRVDVARDRSAPLEDLPVPDAGVVVSADGDELALVSNGRLWTVDLKPDGQPTGRVRRRLDALADMPAWTRDGRELVYLGRRGLSAVNSRGRVRELEVALDWQASANSQTVLVHAGRLFTGTGEGYRADVDLLIEAGRITAVRAHAAHVPGTEVIDASGAVVMPGLIDHHAHFEGHQGGWIGRAWLAFGVTSVVEPGGLPYASRARMESWDSGRRVGPRLFFAGPQLDGDRKYFPFSAHVRDDRRLDWELERADRLGYAMLKTYTHMPIARQQRVLESARRIGLPVSSHELYPALAMGGSRVEHLRGSSRLGYSSKQTALLRSYADTSAIAGASDAAITPTLAVSGGFFDYLRRHPEIDTLTQYTAFYDARYRRGLSALLKVLEKRGDLLAVAAANARHAVHDYYRAGSTIVAGTDSPIFPYGLALVAELAGYTEAGLRPAEVLRTATVNAAAALGATGELGVIATGARADLLIVDGDPLTDIDDLLRLRGTMRGGIYYPLAELLPAATPIPSRAR